MCNFLFGVIKTSPLSKLKLPFQSLIIAPEFLTIDIRGRISTFFNPDSTKTSILPSAIKQKLYASAPEILKIPYIFKKTKNFFFLIVLNVLTTTLAFL